MNLFNSMALFISGGLVVSSIVLSRIGLSRSALSRRSAFALSGMGAGIGTAIFIFYGISNGDLLGSIIVGMSVAVIVGFSVIMSTK